jgi:hypothetical protein
LISEAHSFGPGGSVPSQVIFVPTATSSVVPDNESGEPDPAPQPNTQYLVVSTLIEQSLHTIAVGTSIVVPGRLIGVPDSPSQPSTQYLVVGSLIVQSSGEHSAPPLVGISI